MRPSRLKRTEVARIEFTSLFGSTPFLYIVRYGFAELGLGTIRQVIYLVVGSANKPERVIFATAPPGGLSGQNRETFKRRWISDVGADGGEIRSRVSRRLRRLASFERAGSSSVKKPHQASYIWRRFMERNRAMATIVGSRGLKPSS